MSPHPLSVGTRLLAFGALTWLPVRCLFQLWSEFVSLATNHGSFFSEGFEYFAYSTPDPPYFIEIIAVGAALITILWMLSTGRVPGWKWLGITAVVTYSFSACWTIERHNLILQTIFNGTGGVSDQVFDPRMLAILILCIEVSIIVALICSWRRRRRLAQPALGDTPSPPEAETTAPVRKMHPLLLATFLILTAGLLAWGGARLVPGRAPYPSDYTLPAREAKMRNIDRAKQPAAWADAARDVAYEREPADTVELWQEIIRIEEILYGPESREVNMDILSLCRALFKAGRPKAEAEPWLRRSLEHTEKLHRKTEPDRMETNQHVMAARRSLAEVLRDQGKFAEAKLLYEKLIPAESKLNPPRTKPKRPLPLEKDFRALLEKMGETPEAIQNQLDRLTAPAP